jgi:hypothetical protein
MSVRLGPGGEECLHAGRGLPVRDRREVSFGGHREADLTVAGVSIIVRAGTSPLSRSGAAQWAGHGSAAGAYEETLEAGSDVGGFKRRVACRCKDESLVLPAWPGQQQVLSLTDAPGPERGYCRGRQWNQTSALSRYTVGP